MSARARLLAPPPACPPPHLCEQKPPPSRLRRPPRPASRCEHLGPALRPPPPPPRSVHVSVVPCGSPWWPCLPVGFHTARPRAVHGVRVTSSEWESDDVAPLGPDSNARLVTTGEATVSKTATPPPRGWPLPPATGDLLPRGSRTAALCPWRPPPTHPPDSACLPGASGHPARRSGPPPRLLFPPFVPCSRQLLTSEPAVLCCPG